MTHSWGAHRMYGPMNSSESAKRSDSGIFLLAPSGGADAASAAASS